LIFAGTKRGETESRRKTETPVTKTKKKEVGPTKPEQNPRAPTPEIRDAMNKPNNEKGGELQLRHGFTGAEKPKRTTWRKRTPPLGETSRDRAWGSPQTSLLLSETHSTFLGTTRKGGEEQDDEMLGERGKKSP